VTLVATPPGDGRTVDGTSNLGQAGCSDVALRAMEVEAGIVPLEPGVGHDSARPALEVSNEILVVHLEHPTAGQDGRQWSISRVYAR